MGTAWHWTAIGKHPVAKDFFHLGAADPTLRALWEWVETGFNRWVSPNKRQTASLSFRWWAAGSRKNAILCGVLRASADHIGRPYPLLIGGSGDLKSWRKHWNLLPFACEPTWNRMESFAAGSQRDLPSMEQKLLYLPAPVADWKDFQDRQSNELEPGGSALAGTGVNHRRDRIVRIPVPRIGGGRHVRALSDCYGQWKTRHQELPSIVFMGGTMDAAQLFFFLRPLETEDFLSLWNTTPEPGPD